MKIINNKGYNQNFKFKIFSSISGCSYTNKRDQSNKLGVHLFTTKFAEFRFTTKCVEDLEGKKQEELKNSLRFILKIIFRR